MASAAARITPAFLSPYPLYSFYRAAALLAFDSTQTSQQKGHRNRRGTLFWSNHRGHPSWRPYRTEYTVAFRHCSCMPHPTI